MTFRALTGRATDLIPGAIRFTASVALCFSLHHCKSRGASNVASYDGRPKVLLIGSGGWNSCRIETDVTKLPTLEGFKEYGLEELNRLLTPQNSFTFGQLLHLAKTLQGAGADVKWVSTCFFVQTPKDATIWTLNSDGERKHMPTLDLAREIEGFAGDRQIILIGHSYGGWMSAVATTTIKRPVLATFTLEPISGEFCPSTAPVAGTTGSHPYCRKAPDSGSVDMTAALKHVGVWTNFHLPLEGQTLPVHSGPYAAPVINHALPYESQGPGPFSNPHHLLGLGKPTWDLVCQQALKSLELAGECSSLAVDRWGREIGGQ